MILHDIEALMRADGSSIPQQPETFRPAAAVSTVFRQARPLQEQLGRIAKLLEPIGCLSQLAGVFPPLSEFKEQIEALARVLEPMREFQQQLREVVHQFAPLKVLDSELEQMSRMFCESLRQLAQSLDAAVALHERLLGLAAEYEPARSLRQAFIALAQSFGADCAAKSHGDHPAR